ncbi:MAG: hypothetical protein WCK57_00110 [Verrucomicrobiae bacterium]
MVQSPFLRSIIHGCLTGILTLALGIYLAISEAWTWKTVDLKYPLLILIALLLLLNAFVETARGLWQGFVCGLFFVMPILLACFALSWYFWQSSQAAFRAELRFVEEVSFVLSVIFTPIVLQLRNKVTPKI